jgi:hypothetical protein
MSSIKSRLQLLEELRRGENCPECGLPPDGLGRIVYDRIPQGEPELCPRCGRRLWFVISVDEGEGAV